jgi:hypothetical protein
MDGSGGGLNTQALIDGWSVPEVPYLSFRHVALVTTPISIYCYPYYGIRYHSGNNHCFPSSDTFTSFGYHSVGVMPCACDINRR